MKDNKLYRKAMKEMQELVERVIEDCYDFANDNDYDKDWVLNQFISEFHKMKKEKETT